MARAPVGTPSFRRCFPHHGARRGSPAACALRDDLPIVLAPAASDADFAAAARLRDAVARGLRRAARDRVARARRGSGPAHRAAPRGRRGRCPSHRGGRGRGAPLGRGARRPALRRRDARPARRRARLPARLQHRGCSRLPAARDHARRLARQGADAGDAARARRSLRAAQAQRPDAVRGAHLPLPAAPGDRRRRLAARRGLAARARRPRRRLLRRPDPVAPVARTHGAHPRDPPLRAARRDRAALDALAGRAGELPAAGRSLRRVPAELPIAVVQRELRRALRSRAGEVARAGPGARAGRRLSRARRAGAASSRSTTASRP